MREHQPLYIPDSIITTVRLHLKQTNSPVTFRDWMESKFQAYPFLGNLVGHHYLAASILLQYEFGAAVGIDIADQTAKAVGRKRIIPIEVNAYRNPTDLTANGLLADFGTFKNSYQSALYSFVMSTANRHRAEASKQSYLLGLHVVIFPAIASLETPTTRESRR